MTVDQVNKLRALCLAITSGDLRRPWSVQTSNSWRRIGTDRGDGDVLYPTTHPRDGQPDLNAAPHVLDYIVAAHPFAVLELIEQRDRAWHAIDHLRRTIEGHAEAFAEAEAIRLGVQQRLPVDAYAEAAHAMAVHHDTTGEPSHDIDDNPMTSARPRRRKGTL